MAKLTTDEQALGAATSHQNKHCGRDVLGAGNAQCMACVHVCFDYVCLLVVLAVVGETNVQGQCVATAKTEKLISIFFSPTASFRKRRKVWKWFCAFGHVLKPAGAQPDSSSVPFCWVCPNL